MPRVLICVPVYPGLDDVVHKGVESQLISNNYRAEALYLDKEIVSPHGAQWGLNLAAKQRTAQSIALTHRYDYLFLVEADVALPNHALDILIGSIPNERSVINGWYILHERSGPLAECPTIFKRINGSLEYMLNLPTAPGCAPGVVEVDFSILGCTLIPNLILHSENLFDAGTDATFTNRCLEMGYKIYVNINVHCEHLTLR
jgi:hypothetical protein